MPAHMSLHLCGFSAVLGVWQVLVLLFGTLEGFSKNIFDPWLVESVVVKSVALEGLVNIQINHLQNTVFKIWVSLWLHIELRMFTCSSLWNCWRPCYHSEEAEVQRKLAHGHVARSGGVRVQKWISLIPKPVFFSLPSCLRSDNGKTKWEMIMGKLRLMLNLSTSAEVTSNNKYRLWWMACTSGPD